jgi:hypothetical protein
LARKLLNGFVEERRRRPENRYLAKGCAEEVEARKAIARLLRSKHPLDPELRDHLANLFDPDLLSEQRTIEFVFRRQGTPTDHIRNTAIASHVWRQVKRGVPATKAISNAASEFALSEAAIKKIWNIYRPHAAETLGN